MLGLFDERYIYGPGVCSNGADRGGGGIGAGSDPEVCEVLGSDGQVHTGASPENMEKMERRFRESGKQSLVLGEMLFLNVDGETVRFGLKELASKSAAEVDELIDSRIDAAFERAAKRGAGDAVRDAAKDSSRDAASDEAKTQAKDKAKDEAKDKAKAEAKEKAKQEARQAAASLAKSAARAAAKSAASEAVREAVADAEKAEKKEGPEESTWIGLLTCRLRHRW